MKVKIIKRSWPANLFYDLRGRKGQIVKTVHGLHSVALDEAPCGLANDRTPRRLNRVPADAVEVIK